MSPARVGPKSRRCACAATSPQASARPAVEQGARAGSGPDGSDAHEEHGGARRKCAAYLSGRLSQWWPAPERQTAMDSPDYGGAHASPHALISASAKVRAITMQINYSCCYLKIFVCDAKRSPPAARADTKLHTRTASPLRGY